MTVVRVGVFDENEIFRRGVIACLADDDMLEIVASESSKAVVGELDVAVVSSRIAGKGRFACPLVVCGNETRLGPHDAGNNVLGILPRTTLTPEQLLATVHAAAAGLQINAPGMRSPSSGPLDARSLAVLRLLAGGADTGEISRSLSYSERTIKDLVAKLECTLGARNRTHAVAEGFRAGLI
jgi:DNA-binding CsgD family transcriptional regulator